MLLHLLRKELLEHLMSLRFAIATVLCLVVILCSLYVRGREYVQDLDDYHHDRVTTRTEMEDAGWPWRFAFGWNEVHLAPTPMKIFVRGIREPNRVTMKVAAGTTAEQVLPDVVNSTAALFPSLDLVFFTGIIMSLMALVFGYDAVCGEKECGTLKLVLSYSVPRDQVLLAKWLGGLLALLFPYLIALLAMMILLTAQPGIDLDPGQWNRFGVLVLLSVVYMATIYSLAVWVSALTRRASTSIMILAALWVVFVLAIPNLSPHAARMGRPTDSAIERTTENITRRERIWNTEVREAMKRYDQENGLGPDFEWRDLNWQDKEDQLIGNRRWLYQVQRRSAANAAIRRAVEKTGEKFEAGVGRQVGWTRWLNRFSPYGCFAMAAAELTDTGVGFSRRQRGQVNAYGKILTEYGVRELKAIVQFHIDHGEDPPPWKERRAPIPRFVFVPPAARDYVPWAAADIGILAGMGVVFFLLSHVAFLRYDVR